MLMQTRAGFRSENSSKVKGRTEDGTSNIAQAQSFAKPFRKENPRGMSEITMRLARVCAHRLLSWIASLQLKFQRLPQQSTGVFFDCKFVGCCAPQQILSQPMKEQYQRTGKKLRAIKVVRHDWFSFYSMESV